MFRPAWPGQACSLGYDVGQQIESDLGIELTREQQQRVISYYRVDPVSGVREIRRAALRRPKGAGKSPEGAYCGYAELTAPVLFSHWGSDGQPVGMLHPDPWIQFAAVSEDQTDNVLVWLYDVLADRPDICALRRLDLGRTRIYLADRPGRIEPVTASAGSREGQRITFAVLDQTESWFKENGGHRLAATLRRNVAKMGGWSLELQNAPGLGDGSVADQTAKASDRRARGVLYDTREPPGPFDLGDRARSKQQLEVAYGESTKWVSVERLLDEIADPDTDPSDAMKFYMNVSAPSSDWAFDRERWHDLGGEKLVPPDGELIVAGFDGARHDDATALVAVGVETGNVWLHGVWERPDGADDEWEVPELDVTQAVEELFARWQVWRLYADPPYWSDTVAKWEGRFKSVDKRSPAVVSWWTNRWRPVGVACHNVAAAIRAGTLHHQHDETLSRHVRNAVKRPVNSRDDQGRPLWTLAKAAPGRKIDAAMALVLAWEARSDAIAAGAEPRRRREAFFL